MSWGSTQEFRSPGGREIKLFTEGRRHATPGWKALEQEKQH